MSIHHNSIATVFSDVYMYVSGVGFSPALMWLVVTITTYTFIAVQTGPKVTWILNVYANFWHTEYIRYISDNGGLQVRPTKETITVEFTILIHCEWTSCETWESQDSIKYIRHARHTYKSIKVKDSKTNKNRKNKH